MFQPIHTFPKSKSLSLCLLLALGACGDNNTRDESDAGAPGDGDRGDGDSGDGDASGGSDDVTLWADTIAKIKECGLYQEGDEDEPIQDGFDRCLAQCVVAATCSELREIACAEVPDVASPFYKCGTKCPQSPADGFACSDGKKVPHIGVCDGEEDCSDGSDEEDCEPFACADGEELASTDVECDGFEDCEDGSDEDGCVDVCE